MDTAFASNDPKKASFSLLQDMDGYAKERRTSLSTPPRRSISPSFLQKQETISMNALDMAKLRQFDPRFMLSEKGNDDISEEQETLDDDKDEEKKEESGAGKLLLEKALSVPTSARTRGKVAPFRRTSKSIAMELIDEGLAMEPPLPLLPAIASSATSQMQMMEKYEEAVESLKKKKRIESNKAKLNAPELQGG